MSDIPRLILPRKPQYKKYHTTLDFFSLFCKIEKEYENCFILESLGEQGYDARYSVIGFDPSMTISCRQDQLFVDGKPFKSANPYFSMRDIMPEDVISRNYAGGLVGFLSYETMNYFEPALKLKPHPDFDMFTFGAYLDGLIFDSMTGEIFYFFYNEDRSDLIQKISGKNVHPQKPEVRETGKSKTRDQHREMVEKAIQEIINGNTFQCQIGFQTDFEIKGDTIELYAKLREVNPSPYMFYVKFGDTKLIGASPELLFRLRQGEIETFPLAGTARRGKNAAQDMEFARILLNDPKEIAEHNMLVDLHRNDLGRVAHIGSVKVRRLMDIKKFSHVQHISSEVVGIIDRKEDMFSALARVFPAGTLSGAPKIESMKIIERIENEPRGPYGGAVGHFGFNGDSTHVIPIRTLFIKGNKACSRASGGIVYDSSAENEYQEIVNKSAAIAKSLEDFLI
ncbi:MAG: anthranilate synthase component I family protein [Spirochaetia bacterium]|nr:anthranilate synthase component I family protein [Spirochaetia bacterium]